MTHTAPILTTEVAEQHAETTLTATAAANLATIATTAAIAATDPRRGHHVQTLPRFPLQRSRKPTRVTL